MKKYNLFIVLFFCLVVCGIPLVSSVFPDRSFSESENRMLQELPVPSLGHMLDGRFMSEAEDYASDQIILRDGWIGMKACLERLSGKKENGGVYFASGGSLISHVNTPDKGTLEKSIGYVNALVSSADVPVYFGLIPSAASIHSDRLPDGAPTADELKIIPEIYSRCTASCIDLSSPLSLHAEEYIYYRTDHHWTSLGAYYGSCEILSQLGSQPIVKESLEPVTVSESFLGTSYSASGAWWIEPDSIDTLIPEDGYEVVSVRGSEQIKSSLYAAEQLDKKDKYSFFLGGNQPLCVISSENGGERLLVIRDSYSDCLAPFLAGRFSQVHMMDLRYYRESVSEYIKENSIDKVLVLYSFSGFTDSGNLNLFLLER